MKVFAVELHKSGDDLKKMVTRRKKLTSRYNFFQQIKQINIHITNVLTKIVLFIYDIKNLGEVTTNFSGGFFSGIRSVDIFN
jgi:phage-related protein